VGEEMESTPVWVSSPDGDPLPTGSRPENPTPVGTSCSPRITPLFQGLDRDFAYFNHSYFSRPAERGCGRLTEYG
jgi:hypothetical protein